MYSHRILPLLTAMTVAACGDDPSNSSSSSFCDLTIRELRGCGLLTEGFVQCSEPSTMNRPLLNCTSDCFERANCPQLQEVVCSEGDEESQSPLASCLSACDQAHSPTFACNDGDIVPESYRCDGFDDCVGGEDELGCPTLTCDNGQVFPASYRCDSEPDCSDGSDEVNCPAVPQFNCANGGSVPASYRCDEETDCTDGSDELGCAQTTCE